MWAIEPAFAEGHLGAELPAGLGATSYYFDQRLLTQGEASREKSRGGWGFLGVSAAPLTSG